MATLSGLGKAALVLTLAAPALSAPSSRLTSAEVAKFLVGVFDTQAQFDAADPALKVPPSVAARWLDRQVATMTPVDAPEIGRHVLYLEWRSGGAEGPVSRQRIWAFDDANEAVAMRFYTIKRPEPFVRRGGERGAFRALTLGDLTGYPPECAARFVKLGKSITGRINPAGCRIVSASGRGMRLDVTIRQTKDGFSYQEAGILDSGLSAFAVPPTEPYRFVRTNPR